MHPGGMPEVFDDLGGTFDVFLHPFRMRYPSNSIPVVSAALRPPATVCHPFGMNRSCRCNRRFRLRSLRPHSHRSIEPQDRAIEHAVLEDVLDERGEFVGMAEP